MVAVEVVLLSLALAVDAAIAAAGVGAAKPGRVWLAAALFGGFQSGMAAIGWLGGAALASVAAWDHWVAFLLLAAVGGKAIREGWSGAEERRVDTSVGALLVLAVATSIDALAAGISLPALGAPPWVAVAAIGVVTAACSAAGGLGGGRLAERTGGRLEIVGGLVLIGLGVKIVAEHTLG